MRSKRNQHVVPHEGGWAVQGAGASRATSMFDPKAEATDAASRIARIQGTELVIHNRDGRIQSKDSHGSNPYPPKN